MDIPKTVPTQKQTKTGSSPEKLGSLPPAPTSAPPSGSQDNPGSTHEPKGNTGRPKIDQGPNSNNQGPPPVQKEIFKDKPKAKAKAIPKRPDHDTEKDANRTKTHRRKSNKGYLVDQLSKHGNCQKHQMKKHKDFTIRFGPNYDRYT